MTDAWSLSRSFHHSRFPPERVAAERELSISVCLPARDEAATIGPIVDDLMPLVELGAVDQVAVLDDSRDGTGAIAAARGAEVFPQAALRRGFGPVAGKGDAMWRGLEVLRGEVICFLDADSREFGPHYACGLAGPIACRPGLRFVKGFYRRPLEAGSAVAPEGGGRVTELMARPLLRAFYPELAGFRQPLAGELAARRDLLLRLPFTTGYGVDIGLLVDAWELCGLGAMGQVDLDVRQNRHRPLSELGPMADAVLGALSDRLAREGRLLSAATLTAAAPVRPPAAELEAAAA